jgi:hypothetical protein
MHTNYNINLFVIGGGNMVNDVGDESFNSGGVLEHREHVLEDDSLNNSGTLTFICQ